MQAFGISEAEAVLLDPQQRLLLECAATALSSGSGPLPQHMPASSAAPLGVYVGVASSDYGSLVKSHTTAGAYHATANALSVAAGRVAFAFGLSGAHGHAHAASIPAMLIKSWAPGQQLCLHFSSVMPWHTYCTKLPLLRP